MADRATVARPYARAAFAYAQGARDFASWSKLLGAVAEAAADPRVARLIGHPLNRSEQFEVLRAEVENVIDVEVIAAREIAAPQQKRLMEALKRRLGRDVRMHTRIDDTLIGGAIVRAGDLVIDGSLKGRLARLDSALAN